MDNGSQISAGTIDIPDGPTGPSGAPGEDALFCKKAYKTNTDPMVDTTITQATSYFSRTPVVGDNVIIIADGDAITEGKCWIMSCEVTNVNSTTTTLYINATVATTVPAIPMYRHAITAYVYDEGGTSSYLAMCVMSTLSTTASTLEQVADVLRLKTNMFCCVPGRVMMNNTYYTIQLVRRLSDKIEIETSADGTMKKFQILDVSPVTDIVTTL